MTIATNLGFPRIGPKRELKKSLEAYWKGDVSKSDLEDTAKDMRSYAWQTQKDAGIEHIPSNDFSYYDQMLDMICMVGAVPARYNWSGDQVDMDTYFAMARGAQGRGRDVPAMEMTKWFDTNYHYIVPEFEEGMSFKLSTSKAVDEYLEAKEMGIETRPVLVGPVTFLLQGKCHKADKSPLEFLDQLLPVYHEVLAKLSEAGAKWVQLDEPCLVTDLDTNARKAYEKAYASIAEKAGDLNLLVTTYFESVLPENMKTLMGLPVQAVHLDLVRAPDQWKEAVSMAGDKILSLGVVNGRNIWRADLDAALTKLEQIADQHGRDKVWVAPSCSMLHSPYDLDLETKKLDDELKGWMAFAKQKLSEIAVLAKGLQSGREAIASELSASKTSVEARNSSTRIHNPAVKEREASVTPDMLNRNNPFSARKQAQIDAFGLPPMPTTTIGSFPQTPEVRKARAAFKRGDSSREEYDKFLELETQETIKFQEDAGLDVLVHGEFERNDMVEYFGEKLNGFAFTGNGWVQSYGSRCVKPPVIFGDVSRPEPMTVRWSAYAQSLTDRLVKGMLTGPITILQWSFVRDDQSREATCRQIGLAIRDEVADLEKAGINVIQIDEPAVREGLPLHRDDWDSYLKWAIECFRLSACCVDDKTQIHTHMCYSEFNDIMDSIADMDADVISIETSRSQMELLDAFDTFKYPNDIGPGVYDIHSPRVPPAEEMADLLRKAIDKLPGEQIWVNPDCGLKTRAWPETKAALENMVEAAKTMRDELKKRAAA